MRKLTIWLDVDGQLAVHIPSLYGAGNTVHLPLTQAAWTVLQEMLRAPEEARIGTPGTPAQWDVDRHPLLSAKARAERLRRLREEKAQRKLDEARELLARLGL